MSSSGKTAGSNRSTHPSKASNKRQQFKEQRKKRQQNQRLIAVLAVGIVLVVIAAIIIIPQIRADNTPVGAFTQITPAAYPSTQGLSMGDPKAPVKIDVYEDYQCPVCKEYTDTVQPAIIETYVKTGKAYYTFHQFPFLDSQSVTKESHQSANASMCAAEQGRFWDYHDMLFANQGTENSGAYTDKRLVAFAQALGLDMTKFNTCFQQKADNSKVEADYNQGNTLGVTGTPTVFVNGKAVSPQTFPSFDVVRQAVEAALAGK